MTYLRTAFIAKWQSLTSQLLCHMKNPVMLSRPAIWKTLIWMDCMRNLLWWKLPSPLWKWKVATVRCNIWNCFPKQMYHLWISGRSAPIFSPSHAAMHTQNKSFQLWHLHGEMRGIVWMWTVSRLSSKFVSVSPAQICVQEVPWKQKTLGCSQEKAEVLQTINYLVSTLVLCVLCSLMCVHKSDAVSLLCIVFNEANISTLISCRKILSQIDL